METSLSDSIAVRPARPEDVDGILELLDSYAKDRVLLPRTREDLLSRLGNFLIAEKDGKIVGCGALRDYEGNLYEVRSLAVHRDFNGYGIGSKIVTESLKKVKGKNEPVRVFALTYRPHFFKRLGFEIVSKDEFPEKIWSDCSICRKKDCCDEIAVLIRLG